MEKYQKIVAYGAFDEIVCPAPLGPKEEKRRKIPKIVATTFAAAKPPAQRPLRPIPKIVVTTFAAAKPPAQRPLGPKLVANLSYSTGRTHFAQTKLYLK